MVVRDDHLFIMSPAACSTICIGVRDYYYLLTLLLMMPCNGDVSSSSFSRHGGVDVGVARRKKGRGGGGIGEKARR